MLNHTYTSVKNANLVDCGKKQHIASQPSPLLKDNFLGEFRTELDKKKVLANLGVASDLSLEWEYIKGDIGRSEALMTELDSRTTYVTQVGEFKDKVISIIKGIQYLETVVGSEQEGEDEQNARLTELESKFILLAKDLDLINKLLKDPIKTDIDALKQNVDEISKQIANINDLIKISSKANNALVLIPENSEQLAEEETPGLYVPDLEPRVEASEKRFEPIETNIQNLQTEVETVKKEYVSKTDLGGDGDFTFIKKQEFESYKSLTETTLESIQTELDKTVKTGEDGHVDTLYVNTISKNNTDDNIKITDSFEVTSGIPLDVRCVVENLDELKALPANVCYAGMGVIVNSLSSLYILRKPSDGNTLTQEYISNIYNWKCPEDLVTVALTRQDYEALEEINPNVFYYIYEDEVKLTQEPKREDFLTEEEFLEAWQVWTESLKTLSQEYMSASWGVDIENKLALKASTQSVLALSKEIEELKGGETGISLESLNTEIIALKNEDLVIDERLDEIINEVDGVESGRLINVETLISTINEKLETYATKDELAKLPDDFNFVESETYEEDKKSFKDALAENLTTQQITLNGTVVSVEEGVLQVNSLSIAKVSEVPNITVLPQDEYDKLANKDKNTYYYTYDADIIYVTQTELTQKLSLMQQQISDLSQKISTLEQTIKDLKELHPQNEENV